MTADQLYTVELSAHDVRLIRLALDQWTKCEDLLARLPNPDDDTAIVRFSDD